MKVVELYGRVRYAVQIEGLSRREAARQFGIDPRTVAKMLAFSVPPGYRRRRPPARPKLDPFTGIIDSILMEDEGSMFSFRRRRFTIPAPLSNHACKGSSQTDEAGVISAIFGAITPRRRFFVEFRIGPGPGDPTCTRGRVRSNRSQEHFLERNRSAHFSSPSLYPAPTAPPRGR
jgi:hypothetical protein